MAWPLPIPHRENATIEDLKQDSRVGCNETAIRCSAIQMLLAGVDRDLICKALLVTKCAFRNEEKLLERLDQAILDAIANPDKNPTNYR